MRTITYRDNLDTTEIFILTVKLQNIRKSLADTLHNLQDECIGTSTKVPYATSSCENIIEELDDILEHIL